VRNAYDPLMSKIVSLLALVVLAGCIQAPEPVTEEVTAEAPVSVELSEEYVEDSTVVIERSEEYPFGPLYLHEILLSMSGTIAQLQRTQQGIFITLIEEGILVRSGKSWMSRTKFQEMLSGSVIPPPDER